MGKQKKKRKKKYRPADSPIGGGSKIHRFVAEKEAKTQSRKKLKRRMIIWGAILVLLLGLYSLIF